MKYAQLPVDPPPTRPLRDLRIGHLFIRNRITFIRLDPLMARLMCRSDQIPSVDLVFGRLVLHASDATVEPAFQSPIPTIGGTIVHITKLKPGTLFRYGDTPCILLGQSEYFKPLSLPNAIRALDLNTYEIGSFDPVVWVYAWVSDQAHHE